MPLNYTIARIFTSEAARCNGKPLYLEIVNLIHEQKISARCQVTQAVAGCYENGKNAWAPWRSPWPERRWRNSWANRRWWCGRTIC